MNKNIRYGQKKALNQRECELLLRGVRGVDYDLFKFESEFIAFPGDRVGLSPDKTTLIHEDWLNWRRCCVVVLLNDPFNQGRESGPCDSCRQSVRQRVESQDMTLGAAWMQTANLVQLLDDLQEPVLLLTTKSERFAQKADL
jgi:hypothetical protein